MQFNKVNNKQKLAFIGRLLAHVGYCPEHGIVVAYKCDNVKQTLWSFWWLHFGFSAHTVAGL